MQKKKPIGEELEKYVPIYPASNPSLSDIADPSQGLRRRPRPWFVILGTLIELGWDVTHPFHDKMVNEGLCVSHWKLAEEDDDE
jgi:hypothetical protein